MKSTTASERDSLSLDVLANTYAAHHGDVATYAVKKLLDVHHLLGMLDADLALRDSSAHVSWISGEVRVAMREISDVMEALQ